MYLKCQLPDGYFRIFDDISDLVIPNERIMITFPPPPEDMEEGAVHGISVWDAIDCLSEGGKYAISHLIGIPELKGADQRPMEFICNPRREELAKEQQDKEDGIERPPMWQRFPHHKMMIFKDSKDVTVVFVTQYPVYVCNELGKTIEKV